MKIESVAYIGAFLVVLAAVLIGKSFSILPDDVLVMVQGHGRRLLEACIIALAALPFVYIFFLRVILSNRLTEGRLELIEKVIEGSNEAVMITDLSGRIQEVNQAFTRITGFSREEAVGNTPDMMKSGRHDKSFYSGMWESIQKEGHWQGEVWDRRKNGEVYPKWLTITRLDDHRGKPFKYVANFNDLSVVRQVDDHREYLLQHDRLTGLVNRIVFLEKLKYALRHAQPSGYEFAVFVINLDRFGTVNESFGYTAGDKVIKEVGKRLLSVLTERDIVARLGGDRFGVLLFSDGSDLNVTRTARKIKQAMSKSFIVRGQYIFVVSSIGISIFPQDGNQADHLLHNAEVAMDFARDRGGNFYQFYEERMSGNALEHLKLETNLRYAIENEEFVLMYQPQLDMKTGEVYGSEALIRRQEPEWLVAPGVFIGIAEETGLIVNLCEWTLLKACRQAKEWVDKGLQPIRMAVNVSAPQFHQGRIIPKVKQALSETGLDPSLLELEVTERVVMQDADTIINTMHELKDMGIALSIDDFGTGYSSLQYLKRFPVDTIKIDISFIREMTTNKESDTIVRTIIDLSHNLGFRALAEGVETKEQYEKLKEYGCEDMQGFYFAKPLTSDLFEKMLKQGKKLS